MNAYAGWRKQKPRTMKFLRHMICEQLGAIYRKIRMFPILWEQKGILCPTNWRYPIPNTLELFLTVSGDTDGKARFECTTQICTLSSMVSHWTYPHSATQLHR
jgi:hypothetical protein